MKPLWSASTALVGKSMFHRLLRIDNSIPQTIHSWQFDSWLCLTLFDLISCSIKNVNIFEIERFTKKMDRNYVKTVIEGLKSSSSSRVQEALVKIRTKVITDENGLQLFRECGGLEYLVPHLRKPNERILDLALSILGNCCLDDQTCLAVSFRFLFIYL